MAATAISPLLAALEPLKDLDDGAFETLVSLSAAIAAGHRTADELQRAPAMQGVDASRSLHRALLAFFLEAARGGVSTEAVLPDLAAILPEKRARAIAALLAEGNAMLRAAVSASDFGPPEIVDVQWQRSTVVAPTDEGRALYVITLSTRQPGQAETSRLQFSANVEQLTALVTDLKGAIRQVDRECGS